MQFHISDINNVSFLSAGQRVHVVVENGKSCLVRRLDAVKRPTQRFKSCLLSLLQHVALYYEGESFSFVNGCWMIIVK